MMSAEALSNLYNLVKESVSFEIFLEKYIKSERETQELIKDA